MNKIKYAVQGKLVNALKSKNRPVDINTIKSLTYAYASKTSSLTVGQAANIFLLVECHANAIFAYYDKQPANLKNIVHDIKTVNGFFRFPSPAHQEMVFNFFDRNQELIKKIITLAGWKSDEIKQESDIKSIDKIALAVQELKTKMAIKPKKAIRCISSGKCYTSILEASKLLKIDASNISKQLKGKRKTVGGFSFAYIQSYQN